MKIRCDVCDKDEASLYCTADEAALCAACDHRVHHANKLAGKHQRFSLLHPSPKQFPLCDICQERRALLFCQEHRAILCRDCDLPIHKANELTKKHNRFLLTGVKLSATSDLYSPQSSDMGSDHKSIKPSSVQSATSSSPITCKTIRAKGVEHDQITSGSASSISEYLMETLPGWRFEDFLDPAPSSFGFFQSNADDVLTIWDVDLGSRNTGICLPQALPDSSRYQYPNMGVGGQMGLKELKEAAINNGRKWRDMNGCLAVPEIISPTSITASKRSRNFC